MLFFISTDASLLNSYISFSKQQNTTEREEMGRGLCPPYLHVGAYVIFSPALDIPKSNVTSIFVLFPYH